MPNGLESSALFFANFDGTNINSFVSMVGSTLFRPIVVRKMVFKQLQRNYQPLHQHNSISRRTLSVQTQVENFRDIWKVTSPLTAPTEYGKTVGKSIEFVHTYPHWIVIYLAKIAPSL